jgi:hypothetical protein
VLPPWLPDVAVLVAPPVVAVMPLVTVVTPAVAVVVPPELVVPPLAVVTPPVAVVAPPELVVLGPDPLVQAVPAARSAVNRQGRSRFRTSSCIGIDLVAACHYSSSNAKKRLRRTGIGAGCALIDYLVAGYAPHENPR